IPGKRTLQKAMPKPSNKVPPKIKKGMETERMDTPPINNISPKNKARSFVNRLPIFGANGDANAKDTNGKLVSSPTLQLDKPTSSRIVPINGPTEVMEGRKLNPTKMIAIIKRI